MISAVTDAHRLYKGPIDVLGGLETHLIDDSSPDLRELGIEGIGVAFEASNIPPRDGATAEAAREGSCKGAAGSRSAAEDKDDADTEWLSELFADTDPCNQQGSIQVRTVAAAGVNPAPDLERAPPAMVAGVVGAEPQPLPQNQEPQPKQRPIPLWEPYGRSAAVIMSKIAVPEGLGVRRPTADAPLTDWWRAVGSLDSLEDGRAFWARQANGRSEQLSRHGPKAAGWAGPQACVLPTELLQKLWPSDGAIVTGSGVGGAAAQHAGSGASSSGGDSPFSVLNFMGPTQPLIFVKTIGMSSNSGGKSRFARLLLRQGCDAAGSDSSSSRPAVEVPLVSSDMYIIDKYTYTADYEGLAVYKLMLAEYLESVDSGAFEESMRRNKSLKGGKQNNHREWETDVFKVKGSKGMSYVKLRWRSWWPGLYTVNAPKATTSKSLEQRPRNSTALTPQGFQQGQASCAAGPLPQPQLQNAGSLTVAPLDGPYTGAGPSSGMGLQAHLGVLAAFISCGLSGGQHMLGPQRPDGQSHFFPGPTGAPPPHAHGGAPLSAGRLTQQPSPQLTPPSPPPPTQHQQQHQLTQPLLQPPPTPQFLSCGWMIGGHEHAELQMWPPTPPQATTAALQPQQQLHTSHPQLQLTPAACPQQCSPQQLQQQGGPAWTAAPTHAVTDGLGGLGLQQQQQQFVGPPHPHPQQWLPLPWEQQALWCGSQQLQPPSAVASQSPTPLMLHQQPPGIGDAGSSLPSVAAMACQQHEQHQQQQQQQPYDEWCNFLATPSGVLPALEQQQQLSVSADLLSSTLGGSLLCGDEQASPAAAHSSATSAAMLGAEAVQGLPGGDSYWQLAAVHGVAESREGLRLAAEPCGDNQAGHAGGAHRAKRAAAEEPRAGLEGQSPAALPPQVAVAAARGEPHGGGPPRGAAPVAAAALTGAPRGIPAGPAVAAADDEGENDGETEVQRRERKQRVQAVEKFFPVYLESRLCGMGAAHDVLRSYVKDLGDARDLLTVRDHNSKGHGLLNMLMYAAITLGAGCGDNDGSANTIVHTSGSSGSSHGGDGGGGGRGQKLEELAVQAIEVILERLEDAAAAAGLTSEVVRKYRRLLLTQADRESHDTPNHTCARFKLLVVQGWLLERCDASMLLVATKDGWLPLATACRARHRAAAVAYLRRARDLGLFEAGKLPASARVNPREVILADLTRFNKYYRNSGAREILEEAILEVWPDGGGGAPSVFDGMADAETLKHDAEELQRVLQNLDLTASSSSGGSGNNNNNNDNTKDLRSRGREAGEESRSSWSSSRGGGYSWR